MSQIPGIAWTRADYDRAAEEYQAGLPLEHYMEGRAQATQREITLESLALVRRFRPDLYVFNEMLVQYFHRGNLRQVVPDNMVVLSEQNIEAQTSFNVELDAGQLFWMLEYVSRGAKQQRKDYELNLKRYEKELKAPYYLVFDPQTQDLRLYRLRSRKYQSVPVNENGRLAIPELEVEAALVGGWVRFWHRGRFLELPAALEERAEREKDRADKAEKRADEADKRADEEKRRADEEKRRADNEKQSADVERKRANRAESEVAHLRELLARIQEGRANGRNA